MEGQQQGNTKGAAASTAGRTKVNNEKSFVLLKRKTNGSSLSSGGAAEKVQGQMRLEQLQDNDNTGVNVAEVLAVAPGTGLDGLQDTGAAGGEDWKAKKARQKRAREQDEDEADGEDKDEGMLFQTGGGNQEKLPSWLEPPPKLNLTAVFASEEQRADKRAKEMLYRRQLPEGAKPSSKALGGGAMLEYDAVDSDLRTFSFYAAPKRQEFRKKRLTAKSGGFKASDGTAEPAAGQQKGTAKKDTADHGESILEALDLDPSDARDYAVYRRVVAQGTAASFSFAAATAAAGGRLNEDDGSTAGQERGYSGLLALCAICARPAKYRCPKCTVSAPQRGGASGGATGIGNTTNLRGGLAASALLGNQNSFACSVECLEIHQDIRCNKHVA